MYYGNAERVISRPSNCRSPVAAGSLLALVLVSMPLRLVASDVVEQEFNAAIHARPTLMHGESIFNDTCIACHGPDAGGQPDGRVPAIAAQPSDYLIRQIVDYRHGRRWDPQMEHSTGNHRLVDAQDIADVAGYVSHLPAVQATDVGPHDVPAGAEALYAAVCASCHGVSARGNPGIAVPRLAGQHYGYLLRQMRNATAARPAFPREHGMLLQRLGDVDLSSLASYLARLEEPDPFAAAPTPAGNSPPLPRTSR